MSDTPKQFKFSFTHTDGKLYDNVVPEWTPTVEGDNQSLLVYEVDPPLVLATLPMGRPRQELWDLAKAKLMKKPDVVHV
jgi:hypothetical protein